MTIRQTTDAIIKSIVLKITIEAIAPPDKPLEFFLLLTFFYCIEGSI